MCLGTDIFLPKRPVDNISSKEYSCILRVDYKPLGNRLIAHEGELGFHLPLNFITCTELSTVAHRSDVDIN